MESRYEKGRERLLRTCVSYSESAAAVCVEKLLTNTAFAWVYRARFVYVCEWLFRAALMTK